MTFVRTTLHTPRLLLEPTGRDHANALFEAAEASLKELAPWLAWAGDTDPSSIRDFTVAMERAWAADAGWCFTILHADEAAGTIALDRHDRVLRSATVGYWLRSDLGGRGLMTEAGSALIDFAFGTVGLHRLELHAAPGNHGSVRVAEKLGFSRRGVLRHGSRGTDGYHDVYVFDLLESDPR
jgi:ribosomal-protein-serine acetyltransferase